MKNFRFRILVISFLFFFLSLGLTSYAKEITIIYSGQTHGMIYPCTCPIEPDGGLARRAALIKKIRNDHPNNLLLDSGDFFAGGIMDEYTQNTQLDSGRSLINLKAMALMKYDAVAVGDDEFNFGKEFFDKAISEPKLSFISCNLTYKNLLPFIIKEIDGIKIGIIGVSPVSLKQKIPGIEINNPNAAVSKVVSELKNKGVGIIVLLSQLQEEGAVFNLINSVQGIDIVIEGHSRAKEAYVKMGDTLVLRPAWEGRKLGKLTLVTESGKITDYKVEEMRLSDQISDDPQMLSILPKCFLDSNCKKEGFMGSCQDPGSPKSQCLFVKANKVGLFIITSKDCFTCENESTSSFLKKQIPGLTVSYLYYPDKKAKDFIKKFNVSGLPFYFLDKELEKEKNFDSLKANLKLSGDYYTLPPQVGGVGYFFNRENLKGKFDLFISLYNKNVSILLNNVREFNPQIHFLSVENEGGFEAANGRPEVEEYLRAVCVKEYYPQSFWDYISCRVQNITSSWWENCASNLDINKIKTCATGSEGSSFLKQNISLNKELIVMFGPTYLVDNQEIFSSKEVPTKEEFQSIIKR